MIATHNIKVNGRWIHAGEEYGTETPEAPVIPEVAEDSEIPAEETPAEEKKETKPRTSTRRKKISE